jgi:hypothetical protein
VRSNREAPEQLAAPFRYGIVFLLIVSLLLFEIVAPDARWARALALALAAGALTVTAATSRERGSIRRLRAAIVGGAAVIVVAGTATGVLGVRATFLASMLVEAAIPVALIGGLLRLVKERGVTFQVVAGALAIYLLVGLLFASVIAFVSHVQNGAYFAQTGSVSNGTRVYFSFTVLTTTGFGDYTARTAVGHALSVLEMLTGQLYLVTVIGVVIGNFAGARR